MPRKFTRSGACAQTELRGAKAWFCLRELFFHKILGELSPADFRDFRENPTRTDLRRFGVRFSLPRDFLGHTYHSIARFTLSAKGESIRQIECAFPKTSFWNAQLIIKNIKPQAHGKSQRSEIFVNKAAEPRRKRAMPDRVLRQTRLVRSREKRGFACASCFFTKSSASCRLRIFLLTFSSQKSGATYIAHYYTVFLRKCQFFVAGWSGFMV